MDAIWVIRHAYLEIKLIHVNVKRIVKKDLPHIIQSTENYEHQLNLTLPTITPWDMCASATMS